MRGVPGSLLNRNPILSYNPIHGYRMVSQMSDVTTIAISKGLRDRLAGLGSKRETYEKIIGRLIETAGAKR